MEKPCRKRGENWDEDEKDILRQLVAESGDVMFVKTNKNSINMMKREQWKIITQKFNALTGKNRTESEVKFSWKRIKLADKAAGKQYLNVQLNPLDSDEGSVTALPLPTLPAVNVPYEFVIKVNDNENDSSHDQVHNEDNINFDQDTTTEKSYCGDESSSKLIINIKEEPGSVESLEASDVKTQQKREPQQKKKHENHMQIINKIMRQSVCETKIKFIKRKMEMLEELHSHNMKIAKLKIQKLENEIDLLNNRMTKPRIKREIP